MKKLKRNSAGFTFTELIMVVVILGMIAAFAIPDYTKSRDRSTEKSMAHNLEAISEAWKLLQAQGRFDAAMIASLPWGIAGINTNLNMYLVEEDGVVYVCDVSGIAGWNYQCTATGGWTLIINPETTVSPYCLAGTCPQCNGTACPY